MVYWHAIDKKEALENLKSHEEGLSRHEAFIRLEKYGKNELKETHKISPFMIFIQQFKSVFIAILFFAAIFSLFIEHYVDVLVIAIIILLNSIIGFLQQYKAEKTIAEMKNLLVPKVKVFRDNKLEEIGANELVPGDVISLSEGDKIMADCRVLHSNELETNEAILTGESFSQSKSSETLKLDAELANRENMLYMGTLVVRGSARAIVVATGMNTEFGKIARIVQTIQIVKTPLEIKFDSLSKKLAIIILVLAAITSLIGFFRGENIFDMILAGISIAVGVIPEGLPAVMAITLALAIGRMQKHNALIRRLPAAETLGRTTVICVDKTGTLTEEEMTVTRFYCGREYYGIKDHSFYYENKKVNPLETGDIKTLLKIGIMCNNARIEKKDGKILGIFGDPTEKALVISADKAGLLKREETEREARLKEYSFSSKRKMMSIVRKTPSGIISYVKGAPDIILKHSTHELVNGRVIHLTTNRKQELITAYQNMASQALRVLGFAYREVSPNFNQETAETNLIFVGYQGIIDPPRKEVAQSIKECIDAGIKVKMLTGDSLLTAEAVSKMIGLDGSSIEGRELEKMSDSEFSDAVRTKCIFARITPEIKYKIVQTLKKQNEIVAVTGDGINDVLALKDAHIGVAMGIRGTDVARESSDMVLLDDNFSSIVYAVKEGRRVYDNLHKSIKFHLAANIHELFLVLFALMLAFPLPMLPIAILWINLITDSLPSIALSFENAEEDIMKRKPIKHEDDILKNITPFIVTAGIISFIVSMALFIFYYKTTGSIDLARTVATTACAVSEFFLVFTCRSNNKNVWKIGVFSNRFLVYSVLGAFILQMIAIYYLPLASVFSFVPLSASQLTITILASSAALIFFEAQKFVKSRKS
jgi:Ca2+-transporting ATPase